MSGIQPGCAVYRISYVEHLEREVERLTEPKPITKTRLTLWAAENSQGSVRIFEEMAEPPIHTENWLYIYPVYVEREENGARMLMSLPKEAGIALSRHFRQWFGELMKEATCRRSQTEGTNEQVKKTKEKYELTKYEVMKAEQEYATALFVNTRQPCKNCGEDVYVGNVEGQSEWRHVDLKTCQQPAPSRE